MLDTYVERCLRTFNDKAARLNELKFLASFNSGKTSYVWHMKPGVGLEAERNLPDREEIDAFVNTARLFMQDRDGISVRAIADLYEQLPVPEEMRAEVREIRRGLNAFLDSHSPFLLRGEHLTRRRIKDTMLYGGIAHVDPKWQPEYDRWRQDEALYTAIESELVTILGRLTQAVFWIRQVNLKALEHLSGSKADG